MPQNVYAVNIWETNHLKVDFVRNIKKMVISSCGCALIRKKTHVPSIVGNVSQCY
jgi:hypothetical protein